MIDGRVGGTRVLHVDDDLDILEITRLSFGLISELEVLQCRSAQEAIEKAEAFGPDILVLDVLMPGMTGPELLAELRRTPGLSGTPAIFMTARIRPDELRALFEQGADHVITKPFDPLTLGAEVAAFAAGRASPSGQGTGAAALPQAPLAQDGA